METAEQSQDETEQRTGSNSSILDNASGPDEQEQQQEHQGVDEQQQQSEQQSEQQQEAEQQEHNRQLTERQSPDQNAVEAGSSRLSELEDDHEEPNQSREEPESSEGTHGSQDLSGDREMPLEEKPPDSTQAQAQSMEEEPPPYSEVEYQPPGLIQHLQPLRVTAIQQPLVFAENQLQQHLHQQLQIQQSILEQHQRQSPQQSPFRILQQPRRGQSRDWTQSIQESIHRLQRGSGGSSHRRGIVCCGVSGLLSLAMGFNFVFMDLQDTHDGISVVLILGIVFMVFGVSMTLSCLRLCCIQRMEQAFTPIEDSDQDGLESGSYGEVSPTYPQSFPSYSSALPHRGTTNYQLISTVPSEPEYRYPENDLPPAYSDIFKDPQ